MSVATLVQTAEAESPGLRTAVGRDWSALLPIPSWPRLLEPWVADVRVGLAWWKLAPSKFYNARTREQLMAHPAIHPTSALQPAGVLVACLQLRPDPAAT